MKKNTSKQASPFDAFYSAKKSYYGLEPLLELQEYVPRIAWPEKPKALDLGCGEGRDSLFLAAQGFSVYALDASAVGIQKLSRIAQEKNYPILASCGDVLDFEFEESSFDLILARTLLGHLHKERIEDFIKTIKRATKVDGCLFIQDFITSDPGCVRQTANFSECSDYIRHYFKPGEILNAFRDWRVLKYSEYLRCDLSHGTPHYHSLAVLVAQKNTPFAAAIGVVTP